MLGKESVEEYITRMKKPSSKREKWGSDKELTMFADLLTTSIFTWMADMPTPMWLRFKPTHQTHEPFEAIYLENSDSHYTVVTGVEELQE